LDGQNPTKLDEQNPTKLDERNPTNVGLTQENGFVSE
jgi:hypothetical protein